MQDMRDFYKIRKYFRNYDYNRQILDEYSEIIDGLQEEQVSYLDDSDLDRIKMEVVIRDLLYYQLDGKERELIDMVFRDKLPQEVILARLFISESTFYRRMGKIYKQMDDYLNTFREILK